jgi:hypothetical protein
MHLARPENILLATRSADEGRTLMTAIQGAFGPHNPGQPIDADTASLAADLWHTIASRDQADIRHALHDKMLDFDTLFELAHARAAVVGPAVRPGRSRRRSRASSWTTPRSRGYSSCPQTRGSKPPTTGRPASAP